MASKIVKIAADNIKTGQVVDESIPEPPISDKPEDDDYEPDELPLNFQPSDPGALEAPEFPLVVPEKSATEQTSTEGTSQTDPYLPSNIQSQHQQQTNTILPTNTTTSSTYIHQHINKPTSNKPLHLDLNLDSRQFAHLSAEHGIGPEHQFDRITQTQVSKTYHYQRQSHNPTSLHRKYQQLNNLQCQ